MDDPTQASSTPEPPVPPLPPPSEPDAGAPADLLAAIDAAVDAAARDAAAVAAARLQARIQTGLLAWLVIILLGSVLTAVLGHVEGAMLFAGAGMFALAQASDAAMALAPYREWVHAALPRGSVQGTLVRFLVRSLVPLAGAAFYLSLAQFARANPAGEPHGFAFAWCVGAAVVSLALVARPVADFVMRLCFRGPAGRTRRLTARLVVLVALFPVPGLVLSPALMAQMQATGTPLLDSPTLVAQLVGEVAIAFAGVGLFVRRGVRESCERLGLGAIRRSWWLVAAVGVAAAFGLNAATDAVEHQFLPALWLADNDTMRSLAEHMPLATAVLLGVSAGAGEELMVRGALQPRLGIALASLVFAAAHVQYTWFGMLTVGLMGLLLGVVRKRTNTTTAIVVHALYDTIAALTTGH